MTDHVTVVRVAQQVKVRDTTTLLRVVRTPQRVLVTPPAQERVTVVREPQRVVVRGLGLQGPPGPAGQDGASGSTLSFFVEAGFDLAPFHVVAPRMTDDSVRLASNDVIGYVDRPLWLTLAGALAGEQVLVLSEGRVDNGGWNWAQAPIYLGVNGQLTQTPPAAEDGAVFSAQLGYAIGPTSMYFERTAVVQLSM
jgi:hypothetical protein